MVRFAEFLDGRVPSEELLREYLSNRGEWLALEFKAAKQEPVLGLRKTVAAFSNRDGGDLFLGVDDSSNPVGTTVDASRISEILRQEGAPRMEGVETNLLHVVREPLVISLASGGRVFWIDAAPYGEITGALKPDGTLGLFDRPGAESPEISGFAAIELFRRRTRARLLRDVYVTAERIIHGISWTPQEPNSIREDLIAPVRRLLDSDDWARVASEADWTLTGSSYLGPLLGLPSDYAEWRRLPYPEFEARLRMRRLIDLDQGIRRLRDYLVNERILSEGYPQPRGA